MNANWENRVNKLGRSHMVEVALTTLDGTHLFGWSWGFGPFNDPFLFPKNKNEHPNP